MFSLHLRRRPAYYVVTLLVPTVVFSVLTLVTLTLQPGCSDRIALGPFYICSFLALLVNEQESRAIARKQRDAAAVLCGLKFADIHYKLV